MDRQNLLKEYEEHEQGHIRHQPVRQRPAVLLPNDTGRPRAGLPVIIQSRATSNCTGGTFTEKGKVFLYVRENRTCRLSRHTGIHVVRKKGVLELHLVVDVGLLKDTAAPQAVVRCTLVRRDPTYTNYTVDTVCKHHKEEVDSPDLKDHMLQAVE